MFHVATFIAVLCFASLVVFLVASVKSVGVFYGCGVWPIIFLASLSVFSFSLGVIITVGS